jgi:hypothetical protein
MYLGQVGIPGGKVFLHLGTVFHGTGSLTDINGDIGPQGFLGQAQIMTVDPHLAHLGQERRLLSQQIGRQLRQEIPRFPFHRRGWLGQQDATLTGYAHIKDQRSSHLAS